MSNLKIILGIKDENHEVSGILSSFDYEDQNKITYEEFKKIMVMLIKNHSNPIYTL